MKEKTSALQHGGGAMSASITSAGLTAAEPTRTRTVPVALPLLRVGFWAAVAVTVSYTAWDVGFAISALFKWPVDLIVQWAPSAFIPAAWLVLMVSVNRWAAEERRVFSESAIAFGIVYAVLSTSVYFVQLSVAIPKEMAGAQVGTLLWEQPRSFPYAMDILGYTFMSLSALFAAFALRRNGVERQARWALIVAGLPAFVLPIQLWWLPAEFAAAPTLIGFPAAGVLLALLFHRESTAHPRGS
jgi:hypothetical protein